METLGSMESLETLETAGRYEAADRILGAVLVICTTLGIYGNALSLVYFKNQKGGGGNLFWHRTYSLLSAVDLLICIAQIPVIQALIVGRTSSGLLLQDSSICSIWSGTWAVVQPISNYIVLFLATGRLFVLVLPGRRPNFKLPYRFMWGGVLVLLGIYVGPALSQHFDVEYDLKRVSCFIEPAGKELVISREKLALVRAMFLSAPFLPLLVVTGLSAFLLKRAGKEIIITPTVKNHRFASHTIQIISAISLVCNLLTVCCAMYLLLLSVSETAPLDTPLTAPPYMEFVTQDVVTAVNSALHPAVFLFRMKPFRQYVSEWGNPRTSFATGLSQMSMTARRSSLVTRLSGMGGSLSSRLSSFSRRSSIRPHSEPIQQEQQLTVLSEGDERCGDNAFQDNFCLDKKRSI